MAERKRVVLMTEGSRGDHQPYVALAVALQERYDLKLVVNAGFQDFAREHGVRDVDNFEFDFRKEAADIMKKMVGVQDPSDMIKVWQPVFERLFPKRREEVLRFCKGVDVILLAPPLVTFVQHAAESLGKPALKLYLQPNFPTEAWPPILQDPDNPLPLPEGVTRVENYYKMMEQFTTPFHDAFTQWRAELGLAPQTVRESVESMLAVQGVAGFSTHVCPLPDDAPSNLSVAGYWFLTRREWAPGPELAKFLERGERPVYIGFGSMHHDDPAALTTTVMEAVERAGVRAVLCEGWETLRPVESYDRERFIFVKNVYHPGLLPLCSGAVVHGGAGTTAAAVRAGVPVLVCPFLGDQWFWATRVRNAGVGLKGPSAKDITAENLSEHITRLVADEGMRTRAAALGEQVRNEDSVTPVIERIEGLMAAPQ